MKGKTRGDIEVVAEVRKLDYSIDKPDQYGMDPSQISQLAYYRGLPGTGKPVQMGVGRLIQMEHQGANAAMFPLEYVLDFLKLVAKSGASHVWLGTAKDKPLWACAVITVEGTDTEPDGTRTLEYALAPRIEAGAGDAPMGEAKGVMLKPAAPPNFRVATDADFKKTGEEVASQPETAPKIETPSDVKTEEAPATPTTPKREEECSDCGKMTAEPVWLGAGDERRPVCPNCWIRYEECSDCGELTKKPTYLETGAEDRPVCPKCYEDYSRQVPTVYPPAQLDASDVAGDPQAQAIVEKMKAEVVQEAKPIVLRCEAEIEAFPDGAEREPDTPQGKYSIRIDGKAGPDVSSGSVFGYGSCFSYNTIEEAKAGIDEFIQSQKRWFAVYGRPVEVKLEISEKIAEVGILEVPKYNKEKITRSDAPLVVEADESWGALKAVVPNPVKHY